MRNLAERFAWDAGDFRFEDDAPEPAQKEAASADTRPDPSDGIDSRTEAGLLDTTKQGTP